MHRFLILAAALAAALAVTAAPAHAAKQNPYTPTQVCGAGFVVIDSVDVRTPNVLLGQTYLLYNANTGRNCAVTMKRRAIGKPTPTTAVLQRQGGARRTDTGDFSYYAGPIKVKAAQTCVLWGGGMRVGTASSGFLTDYEHCA